MLNLRHISQPCSPAVRECVDLWGSATDVMTKFNPSRQAEVALNKRNCYMGQAPRLSTITEAYGQQISQAWLEIQIRDLSKYSGCKDKLTNAQVTETATHILAAWPQLKLTEFMLFFHYMKSGRYGHFYGAVDGMRITEALDDFITTRAVEIAAIEEEDTRRRRTEEEARRREKAISFEEWQEIKQLESWIMWSGFMTPDTWNRF